MNSLQSCSQLIDWLIDWLKIPNVRQSRRWSWVSCTWLRTFPRSRIQNTKVYFSFSRKTFPDVFLAWRGNGGRLTRPGKWGETSLCKLSNRIHELTTSTIVVKPIVSEMSMRANMRLFARFMVNVNMCWRFNVLAEYWNIAFAVIYFSNFKQFVDFCNQYHHKCLPK